MIHTVCSQSVTVPPVLDRNGPFAHLLFLREKLHHLPIKLIFSKVHGKLAVRVCKVGQLHFRREGGKEMGLSHKPAPSRLLVNVSWLKTCAVPKLPLACTVHQHFFLATQGERRPPYQCEYCNW